MSLQSLQGQQEQRMNMIKRQTRAKARAKTMRLRRMGVPCTASKWGYDPLRERRKYELTPGEVQSNRRLARWADPGMRL
jgi:hypothetical protein